MPKILIYSTPECPFCHKAKDFFNENKIKFIDYDVSSDSDKAEEMVKKSGQMGVPVIDIDGQIITGFNEDKIKEILKLK